MESGSSATWLSVRRAYNSNGGRDQHRAALAASAHRHYYRVRVAIGVNVDSDAHGRKLFRAMRRGFLEVAGPPKGIQGPFRYFDIRRGSPWELTSSANRNFAAKFLYVVVAAPESA